MVLEIDKMTNQYDIGAREDFNNMTIELGHTMYVKERIIDESYEGYETDATAYTSGTGEIVFLQPLDIEHEMVASGQLDVGDVRAVFRSDSEVKEESIIATGTGTGTDITRYKMLKVTQVRGMNNSIIIYVKGYGKKIAWR